MSLTHFRASSIGDVQRLSQVEARFATVTGLGHRTGFDRGRMPTGRVTISGYSKWIDETADRQKVLSPAIARAQEFVGPDYKPTKSSDTYGVNESSHGDLYERSARGAPARVMVPGDTVPMPDPRDSFGHNEHVRIPRVRGIG